MNAFEALADAQTPAPVKRKLDAAERRRAKARQAEQELKDEKVLSKMYRQAVAKERNTLLCGARGKDIANIIAFMKTMTLSSAPALIELVRDSGWIGSLEIRDRQILLSLINDGIVKVRESAGLPSHDDAIPWMEPPKAFHQIKTLMGLDGH